VVGLLDNSRLSGAFEANVDGTGTEEEVETAFTQMALRRARLLMVSPDPFLTGRQERIIAKALRIAVPRRVLARADEIIE
jgi:hypothetical protein